jgi:glycosyltransferase involved in cell wall biosynthesis
MTSLLYIANVRLPTEKAHGLQIMQNCEAFADAGAQVALWAPRRINSVLLKSVSDIWAYYGVRRNFTIRRIPCIDLLPLVPGRNDGLARLLFYVEQFSFTLMTLVYGLFTQADIYYSRDPYSLFALSYIMPRRKLAYEAHVLATGRGRQWLQRQVVERVGTVVAITRPLGDDLAASTSPSDKFLVAHDGIRPERFASVPPQVEARALLGWPREAFIVGYVGRLQTLAMDKGVGTLVEALRQVEGASLAVIGGPDEMAEALRQDWINLGLDESRFLVTGQVEPAQVPLHLSALDVCAMPHPYTQQFAKYTSPLKLFEYMASQRAIVASDMPGWADVIQHEVNALLVPPGDVGALAAAITRLGDDPALRQRLAERAYEQVLAHHTWEARAQNILAKISEHE